MYFFRRTFLAYLTLLLEAMKLTKDLQMESEACATRRYKYLKGEYFMLKNRDIN